MTGSRDDAASRRESLEQWVAEQADKGRIAKPSGTISSRLERFRAQPMAVLTSQVRRFADRVSDRGLETAAPAIEPEHDHPDHLPYGPSAWHVLPRALRYLGVSEEDTFVDFGCGKGRILHQAAKYPFRRVVGVEISPELVEAARAVVESNTRRHRCRDIEVVTSDAAEFRVPDDMTIAYLFHPFKDQTLDAVLRNIVESMERNPRPIRLIYVRPDQPERVLATGRFRLVKEQRNRVLDASLSFAASLSEVSIFEGR